MEHEKPIAKMMFLYLYDGFINPLISYAFWLERGAQSHGFLLNPVFAFELIKIKISLSSTAPSREFCLQNPKMTASKQLFSSSASCKTFKFQKIILLHGILEKSFYKKSCFVLLKVQSWDLGLPYPILFSTPILPSLP